MEHTVKQLKFWYNKKKTGDIPVDRRFGTSPAFLHFMSTKGATDNGKRNYDCCNDGEI